MKIVKLTGNNVLVEPLPQARQSPGGILYSQSYRDDQTQYRVLAVGPGTRTKKGALIPPEVSAGDRVIAPLYHTHAVLPNNQRVIDAASIIAIVGHAEAP